VVVSACAPTRTETFEIDSAATVVSLDLTDGNVEVVGNATGETPHVVASIVGERTKVTTRLDDEQFELTVHCEGAGIRCSADLEVYLPPDMSLIVDAGSGNVGLADLTLATVDVDAGSGDIDAARLAIEQGRLIAGSGNIRFDLVAAPSNLFTEAGSGDVHLIVPDGDYRLSASSGSGEVSISGLLNNSGAAAIIEAHSGSGNVAIEAR
jgi:DUF4097 and DUF4098 domain-containing protein YvlB